MHVQIHWQNGWESTNQVCSLRRERCSSKVGRIKRLSVFVWIEQSLTQWWASFLRCKRDFLCYKRETRNTHKTCRVSGFSHCAEVGTPEMNTSISSTIITVSSVHYLPLKCATYCMEANLWMVKSLAELGSSTLVMSSFVRLLTRVNSVIAAGNSRGCNHRQTQEIAPHCASKPSPLSDEQVNWSTVLQTIFLHAKVSRKQFFLAWSPAVARKGLGPFWSWDILTSSLVQKRNNSRLYPSHSKLRPLVRFSSAVFQTFFLAFWSSM